MMYIVYGRYIGGLSRGLPVILITIALPFEKSYGTSTTYCVSYVVHGPCNGPNIPCIIVVLNVALDSINLTLFDAIKKNLVVPIVDNVVLVSCFSEPVNKTI